MSDTKGKQIIRRLENVRLSFPYLFKPRSYEKDDGSKGEPQYEATLLMDKERHASLIAQIKADMKQIKEGKWPSASGVKGCLRSGDDKEDLEGYGDSVMFLKAKSRRKPVVVDRRRVDVNEESGVVYAGCIVNAVISYWCSDHPKGGKRILANLLVIQFVKDAPAFGSSAVDPDDVLDDLGEGSGASKGEDDEDYIPGIDGPARGKNKGEEKDDIL